MNESPRVVKVGLFVFIGLILIALLLLKFSKSGALFARVYRINLVTRNVAGIKSGAAVLMAGVPIGNVEDVDLGPEGRTVVIHLRILERYKIHEDARFLIEQAGFLGDQYVAIVPRANEAPLIKSDQTITGEEPFNFQEIARSAAGMMQRVDQVVGNLNEAVTRIDQLLLSQETLTNLTLALLNFRTLSDRALTAMDSVDRLLRTNSPAVGMSVSNLASFSQELNNFSGELHALMETNRLQLTSTISNAETATLQINRILADVEQGKGVAGSLLKNAELEQNVSMLASNLSVASSNLNKFGLWRFLWKPKQP